VNRRLNNTWTQIALHSQGDLGLETQGRCAADHAVGHDGHQRIAFRPGRNPRQAALDGHHDGSPPNGHASIQASVHECAAACARMLRPRQGSMAVPGRMTAHAMATLRHLGRAARALPLLWGLMMGGGPAEAQGPPGDDGLPVLYGLRLDQARAAIDVVSYGCTEASHFAAQLEPAAPGTYRLSITRRRQDRCRMAAHIVTVTLDVPAVPDPAQARFVLVNRLAAPGTLQRTDP
jgi:hypothetical protein